VGSEINAYAYILKVKVVDAVTNACSTICAHLSEPLFDMVLGMVFDYASTNVRPNAVRAIHQLVECVANADPVKTLAKFLPFCSRKIRTELENGASSLRTTSSSRPLPSDATLHWSEYDNMICLVVVLSSLEVWLY
jgi:proteasome activator subunit 4